MFGKLLSFDEFITPTVAKILYYIGLAVAVLGGIAVFVGLSSSMNMMMGSGGTLVGLLAGGVWMVVMILASRIGTELILVVFMIRDELAWSRENQTGGAAKGGTK